MLAQQGNILKGGIVIVIIVVINVRRKRLSQSDERPPIKAAKLEVDNAEKEKGEEEEEEEEEEEIWEEVAIEEKASGREGQQSGAGNAAASDTPDTAAHASGSAIEIVLDNMPVMRERPSGVTKQERQTRVTVHHLHLLCLMAHWLQRHRRAYHPQIRALLLSLVPLDLLSYKEFEPVDSPARHGDGARGSAQGVDVFRGWLEELLLWWNEYYWIEFRIAAEEGKRPFSKDHTMGDENTAALLFTALMYSLGHRARLILHPEKKTWVAVDIFNSRIGQPDRMEEGGPLPYVTAFEYVGGKDIATTTARVTGRH
ncbi:hypothetical protein SYNPS1DRAFT_22575 [Syncephalis pseudoplumigaleata]|uniref:Uncharacterized protein n=1 Tax=Syncephalis pseudoplumigaleata TaxID=1712513 RepID=A0A4V1J1L4_9FUNG|nr:hypothetical protein SYNPS1DRAFT_22575 [Syncephalis pseudoplumigaleata]|eukprot:RKP25469.1 hypothetical protein SYNPS1DRAFT_22575 [Syncephalis pseudoplumigaleata]